jgi:hypothetical protein
MLKNKNNLEIINSSFHCYADNFSEYPPNWNAAASGHTQGTAAFPKRKPLPWSTTKSTINICTYIVYLFK